MAVEFAYTTVPGKIKDLFDKLRSTGIPTKAAVQWLKATGFTSSNDSSLLGVLKQIDFCDDSGTPSEHWRNYRGSSAKVVLANAMRTGYAELFHMYPDAWQRADGDLQSFFATRSTAGQQVVEKTVSTFKALVALADFSTLSASVPAPANGGLEAASPDPTAVTQSVRRNAVVGPSVHIDIQIHIASDATADQIDQIFASMAKHLYKSS